MLWIVVFLSFKFCVSSSEFGYDLNFVLFSFLWKRKKIEKSWNKICTLNDVIKLKLQAHGMMLNGVIFFGHQKTFRYLKFFISTSTYETSRMISKVFIYISVNIFISLFLLLLNLFFCYSTFLSGHTQQQISILWKVQKNFFSIHLFSHLILMFRRHMRKSTTIRSKEENLPNF